MSLKESTFDPNETIILGGGCFWCLEAIFKDLQGIYSVNSGYAGGQIENPTYKQVCAGNTAHAEVVKVEFNSSIISLSDLLRIFFLIHDPTTLNAQGEDKGTQYRSIIIANSEQQKAIALSIKEEINSAQLWDNPIVTEVKISDQFYPAEIEHENYFALHPEATYCQIVIAPKVQKFKKIFFDKLTESAKKSVKGS